MTLTKEQYDARLKALNYKIVCPTLGRSDVIGRKLLSILPHTTLLVHTSEIDRYMEDCPGADVDSTSVMGCAPTFGWAWNHYTEETLVLVDDDITELVCLCGQRIRKYHDEEEALQAIENMILVSRAIGATFFACGNSKNTLYYSTCNPFFLGPKIPGAAKGINGYPRPVQVDARLKARDDVCVMLEAMVKDHFTYHDTRFYFNNGIIEGGKGGNQLTKTNDAYQNDIRVLSDKFGDLIEIKKGSNSGWKRAIKNAETISFNFKTKNDKVGQLFK